MLKILVIIVIVLVCIVVAAMTFGAVRWNAKTRALHTALLAARIPLHPKLVDFHELEGLPMPVQRYFRLVLKDGQPMIASARVRHRGSIDMGGTSDQWKRFTSDQLVVTRRPGFDWDARIGMMPGVAVRVHDAYVGGSGMLRAAVLGLFPVADLFGEGAIAEGELMRFFAEAVWYPTALLPSQGVRWEPVSELAAYGTLQDGPITIKLLFTFNPTGAIDGVRSEARGRTVDGKIIPTPWQGRFQRYEQQDGMLVPREGEVAWLLPDGPKPYWRGTVLTMTYEAAR